MLPLLVSAALAAPTELTWQARLLDPAGGPLDGQYDLTVSLYDAVDADVADAVDSWSFLDAHVDGGFVSVVLSTDTDRLVGNRWVGVAVDSGAELSPRTQLTSVPLAATVTGWVQPLTAVDSCVVADTSTHGLLRYDAATEGLQLCTPSGWRVVTSNQDGSSATTAADSCLSLRQSFPGIDSGVYWVKPAGVPLQAHCEMAVDGGGYTLMMGINPSDGHIGGWGNNYWYGGNDYNSLDNRFGEDFLDADVQALPSQRILIGVHSGDGELIRWRRWDFSTPGQSFLQRINNSFRSRVTGEIAAQAGAPYPSNDPIFAYTGGLFFNFYYGNNGTRISLVNQEQPAAGSNSDDHYGLGVEYCHADNGSYTSPSSSSGSCRYNADAAVAGILTSCQGTDHGANCTTGGNVSYRYLIYVQ